MSAKPFKECLKCGTVFRTRQDFLGDPHIEIVGYQMNFEHLKLGLLLFNHTKPSCNTTLALKVEDLSDLYAGREFTDRKAGTSECPGYCMFQNNLSPCPAQCECAYVREIIQIIKKMRKY